MTALDDWQSVNWAANPVVLPAQVSGMRLLAIPHPDGMATPLYASRDATGLFVGYDGALCAAMGSLASFYAFVHELGHHHHQHLDVVLPATPLFRGPVITGLELQADTYATNEIIRQLPDQAYGIFEAIHGYYSANNSDGGGTHPSDAARAINLSLAWNTATALARCDVRFYNDDAVPMSFAKSVLGAFGYSTVYPVEQQEPILAAIERDGSHLLTGPVGGFVYGTVLRIISRLHTAARFVGSATPTLRIEMR